MKSCYSWKEFFNWLPVYSYIICYLLFQSHPTLWVFQLNKLEFKLPERYLYINMTNPCQLLQIWIALKIFHYLFACKTLIPSSGPTLPQRATIWGNLNLNYLGIFAYQYDYSWSCCSWKDFSRYSRIKPWLLLWLYPSPRVHDLNGIESTTIKEHFT